MKTLNASQSEYTVTMRVRVYARTPQEAFEIARDVWKDKKDAERWSVEVEKTNNKGE